MSILSSAMDVWPSSRAIDAKLRYLPSALSTSAMQVRWYTMRSCSGADGATVQLKVRISQGLFIIISNSKSNCRVLPKE